MQQLSLLWLSINHWVLDARFLSARVTLKVLLELSFCRCPAVNAQILTLNKYGWFNA